MPVEKQKNEFDAIALDRHAVIEASAGTGKTYAIERLFVKLMSETGVDFDRILVLTFTEKATGELRERIRANIRREWEACKSDPKAAERLRFAYDNFDDASIFTIHGFCSRILRQHAFENGELFRVSLEDDEPLYEKMLHELMRKEWKKLFGTALPVLMELSGFPRAKGGRSAWEYDVMKIARSYRPDHGDTLLPGPLKDIEKEAAGRFARMNAIFEEAAKLAGKIDAADLTKSDLYKDYANIGVRDAWVDSRRRTYILPLLKAIAGYRASGSVDIAVCRELLKRTSKGSGFRTLLGDHDDDKVHLMPYLEGLVDRLEELRAILGDEAVNRQLDVVTIGALKRAVERYKAEKAFISYDDMLLAVDRALSGSGGRRGLLLDALRSRYSYGLIDEFQDTDPVQWSIFRKAFLGTDDSGGPGRRLFLVGDPKQAIYSFRGADVYTYLGAAASMSRRSDSAVYSLATNWRSIPPLINAFNALFTKGEWFPSGSIKYIEVKDPDGGSDKALRRKARVYEDKTGRAALSVVDLGAARAPAIARRNMAGFIAGEIKRLTSGPNAPLLIFGTKDEKRILRESDIAVLVKDRSEAKLIETALSRQGIPYSFYKKEGLYQSDEADHLAYLLGAVSDPADSQRFKKALLTPFFSIKPEDLKRYEDLAPSHPLKQLFERWYTLAGRGHWPRLFQSILEDTGVCYREIGRPDGERSITNYRHILENLEKEASRSNLDFNGILERLNTYRYETEEGGEDFDLHRLETEKPKVQLLTIHAAKGLEFPVVFIGGGFTSRPPKESYCKYHDEERRTVYDLIQDAEARRRRDEEGMDEARRLFYVAFTRAKFKLYVPKFRAPGKERFAGPLLHIVSAALEKAFGGHSDDSSVGTIPLSEKGQEAKKKGPAPFIDKAEKGLPVKGKEPEPKLPAPLFPDTSFFFKERTLEIDSFSGLHARAGKTSAEPAAYEEPGEALAAGKDDDAPKTAVEETSTQASRAKERMLPPSKETGSMLHEIFEGIDFRKAGRAPSHKELLADTDMADLIDKKLARYGFTGGFYREEAARIIWATLRTPFVPDGFALADMDKVDKLHETGFYYPLPDARQLKIPDVKASREGFLMGYIDLVFRHGDRYYILDWKSNYLDEGYSPEAVKKSMDEAGYHLQYKLYTIAVVRWLRAHIKDFDYKEHFGGIYYVYLRGRDAGHPENGLFFYRPKDEGEIRGYERMLCEMVNPKGR
ncbi:MAG: UvrD-helicase domain-containing protein [Candidatus Omnitrophica bacterium]|nr:UvrD-helicase domain-containing protein [Candidatus Omnitrophota bacterium]